MPTFRRIRELGLRAVVSAALLAIVVLAGQVPWGEPGDEAVLRLVLRTVHGRVEVCSERSAEEMERLPVHMRGSGEICEGVPVAYRLRVVLDGETLVDERVEPRGLRKDRPHNVDREIAVRAGRSALKVDFLPEMDATTAAPERDAPPSYRLDREIELRPDRVTLVFLDDSAGALELVGG